MGNGGAERQLATLAVGLAERGHAVRVITLYPGGVHWRALEAEERVALGSLFAGREGRLPGAARQRLGAVPRLRKMLRAQPADVLYSFLYVAGALAVQALRGWGAKELTRIPLVWGVRASNARLGLKEKPAFHLCRLRSSRASLIIANSHAGVAYHQRQGFKPPRFTVVANGIDSATFRPRPDAGAAWRREWNIDPGVPLVALVARLHAMKDHPTFLRAAAQAADQIPNLRVLCVGSGPKSLGRKLARLGLSLGLIDRLIWVREQEEMARVYSALDLLVSASAYGEGFSNVVAEAMACGVPCAVTDVGDSARIVGDLGAVVPPRDPEALAEAMTLLLELSPERREELSDAVRRRIVDRFSAAAALSATEQALVSVIAPQNAAGERG